MKHSTSFAFGCSDLAFTGGRSNFDFHVNRFEKLWKMGWPAKHLIKLKPLPSFYMDKESKYEPILCLYLYSKVLTSLACSHVWPTCKYITGPRRSGMGKPRLLNFFALPPSPHTPLLPMLVGILDRLSVCTGLTGCHCHKLRFLSFKPDPRQPTNGSGDGHNFIQITYPTL